MSDTARTRWLVVVTALTVIVAAPVKAQTQITTPLQEFGFNIGDDYHLANYTQLETYWRKLATESQRMVLREIGLTAQGRTQLMAIITSPENHSNLDRYQEISRRLAAAEGLDDGQARELAAEGRAVVWLDGGLHATEVVATQQIIQLVYEMVSRTDRETMRFLDDVVLLVALANPDGMELVSNWYMRNEDPTARSTSGLPQLYHEYAGHDNNRDAFMITMPETENMSRVLYREWFPQIMYNAHQTGPAGTVLFAPPFRDPPNHNLDPLVILGIEAVGAAMHTRLVAEGKGGSTKRSGASYSTWWNGGMRTTPYYHNQIGLLTEIIGNPTPMEIPLLPNRQIATNDLPLPIAPQTWHFSQSIEYSMTLDRAVIDYASRNRENLLFNVYRMGKNSIERGSRDHWTIRPQRIAALEAAAEDSPQANQSGRRGRGLNPALYEQVLQDPAARDPRGFIIPADQDDFLTATKFVNTLMKGGVTIHRATADFTVGDRRYPAGSYVVKAAQAYRPHVMDMFEPQDHPNDFAYPGGPPIPPYDNAGWTLALQMGIEFDRILDGFDGPFERLEDFAVPPEAALSNANNAAGFLLSHEVNDAFIATNHLLAAGEDVFWLTESVTLDGTTYPAGTIYIRAKGSTAARLSPMAAEMGFNFIGVSEHPAVESLKMNRPRVGLWDQYGGSMSSGWTRWLLEQFEFSFEVVYPQTLNSGNLHRDFDVLVFVDGGIPAPPSEDDYYRYRAAPDLSTIPAEYHTRMGSVTADTTIPRLIEFMEEGGTVITIGSSTSLASYLGLPIENHLVDEDGQPLERQDYFVPGSLLEVRLDNTLPLAYGMDEQAIVSFSRSPTFRLGADAAESGIRPVAWFDTPTPLRSGWAWGQERLEGGVAIAEADVGEGKLYLFGPEVVRRAQPHGTFKLFFNGIYLAAAEEERID